MPVFVTCASQSAQGWRSVAAFWRAATGTSGASATDEQLTTRGRLQARRQQDQRRQVQPQYLVKVRAEGLLGSLRLNDHQSTPVRVTQVHPSARRAAQTLEPLLDCALQPVMIAQFRCLDQDPGDDCHGSKLLRQLWPTRTAQRASQAHHR
jgi:hypothetical protein